MSSTACTCLGEWIEYSNLERFVVVPDPYCPHPKHREANASGLPISVVNPWPSQPPPKERA